MLTTLPGAFIKSVTPSATSKRNGRQTIAPQLKAVSFSGGDGDRAELSRVTYAATPEEEHLFRVPEESEITPALIAQTVEMINKAKVYNALYVVGYWNPHRTYSDLKPKLINPDTMQAKNVKQMLLSDEFYREKLRIEFGLSQGGHLNNEQNQLRNSLKKVATSGPKLLWARTKRAFNNAD